MATMRGIPGYLAPEWLGSIITEKVNVYSFGIVIVEITCGWKSFDKLQPDEDIHVLGLFQRRAEDRQIHGREVVEIMKPALWCLQPDFVKRPPVSVVVLRKNMPERSNLIGTSTQSENETSVTLIGVKPASSP
ncbi:hypothetical protein RJ639_000172 [Escallonia herrerae]|uniref:Protein kinase domain-containing protein n=1 Tax=Escallonia herrerae TaxID=1293975 RepID=A0AA89BIK2_9ASTE|nr:hypothetical protein RJ639_000172 [Escallonia herrerae]